jgi:hypothetical protein
MNFQEVWKKVRSAKARKRIKKGQEVRKRVIKA